jgi:hypothetical protein
MQTGRQAYLNLYERFLKHNVFVLACERSLANIETTSLLSGILKIENIIKLNNSSYF